MATNARPATQRAAEKGMTVVGATVLKAPETTLGDGDEGGGDKLELSDRVELMTLAVTCYAAVHQGDGEIFGPPMPAFEHPVKLAEAMRAWIEDGKTL